MHQPADTSFLARRGLGLSVGLVGEAFCCAAIFGLSLALEAFGFEFLVATAIAGLDLDLEMDLFAVFDVTMMAAALASRASLRSRHLRWSLFSLGFHVLKRVFQRRGGVAKRLGDFEQLLWIPISFISQQSPMPKRRSFWPKQWPHSSCVSSACHRCDHKQL